MRISDWSSDVCSSDLRNLSWIGDFGWPRLGSRGRSQDHVVSLEEGRHLEPESPDLAESLQVCGAGNSRPGLQHRHQTAVDLAFPAPLLKKPGEARAEQRDRKSTRLNSSH